MLRRKDSLQTIAIFCCFLGVSVGSSNVFASDKCAQLFEVAEPSPIDLMSNLPPMRLVDDNRLYAPRRPILLSRPHKLFPDAPARTFDEVISIFSPTSDVALKYSDTSLFGSQDFRSIWHRIPQRKAESDMMAARLVAERINEYKVTGGLVIVNSGHAHSVAIAVELAKAGYQPIIKMGKSGRPLQAIAAMKYYAYEMETAKAKLSANAPIAIIMDFHRYEDYRPDEFPSSQEVKEHFNNSIVEITEGEEMGLIVRSNTPSYLRHYRDQGIVLYQHAADPYHNGTPGHATSISPD